MPKRVLVTGAGGFIGSALLQHLVLDRDIDPLGTSRSPAKGCVTLNLLDRSKLKNKIISFKPDVIFHLAGGHVGPLTEIVGSNILTTVSLFETIRSINGYHPRVVIIGTCAEYGEVPDNNSPINERSRTEPLGAYGWVKLMQSQLALQYARSGEDVVIARLFNIIGPGVPVDLAVGKYARAIVSSSKIFKAANLSGVRDFLDIRDICAALVILSAKGKTSEIYNICSQEGILMRDLLKRMIKLSGNSDIHFLENRSVSPGVKYAVGSCAKFKRLSGWRPSYPLDISIRDTITFYRGNIS